MRLLGPRPLIPDDVRDQRCPAAWLGVDLGTPPVLERQAGRWTPSCGGSFARVLRDAVEVYQRIQQGTPGPMWSGRCAVPSWRSGSMSPSSHALRDLVMFGRQWFVRVSVQESLQANGSASTPRSVYWVASREG